MAAARDRTHAALSRYGLNALQSCLFCGLGSVVSQALLDMIVMWLAVYGAAGGIFAIFFVALGARISDPGHKASSFASRAVLVPGVVALWPYLLVRMLIGAEFKG